MSVLFKTPLFGTPNLDTPLFGEEGEAELQPRPKSSTLTYKPKRQRLRRDLPWQLPTVLEKARVADVRGAGGSELPLPELRGTAKVVFRQRASAKVAIALPCAGALTRVLARASGGLCLVPARLAGDSVIDETELALEEALGIEGFEDLR